MKIEKPAIYVRNGCYFCSRVLGVIDKLGADIEVRNIWENQEFERELANATGRTTVPVLYYEDDNNAAVWMPESDEIISFLAENFQNG